MDSPNPQKAAPAIQPRFVLFSAKICSKSPMMSPRMANDMAVAMRATQLARNRRCLFMTVCAPGGDDGMVARRNIGQRGRVSQERTGDGLEAGGWRLEPLCV